MALGDQSKALIIMSKNKGWDPTKVAGGESIANFNKAPDPWELGVQSVGKLPGGTPSGWPDGYPGQASPSADAIDWQKGRTSLDNEKRGTTNANPFAGMGDGSGM